MTKTEQIEMMATQAMLPAPMTFQQDLSLQQTRDPEVAGRILEQIIIARILGLTDREMPKARVLGRKLMRVN